MPCDKNYPYCNNPLNWERAAHQKEKGGKGLEVRVVVRGDLSTSLESGPSLEAHWDDEIEVN